MTNEKKFSVNFEGFPDLPDLPNCEGTEKLTLLLATAIMEKTRVI